MCGAATKFPQQRHRSAHSGPAVETSYRLRESCWLRDITPACFSRSLVWWLGFIPLFRFWGFLFSFAVAAYVAASGAAPLELFGPGEGHVWWRRP